MENKIYQPQSVLTIGCFYNILTKLYQVLEDYFIYKLHNHSNAEWHRMRKNNNKINSKLYDGQRKPVIQSALTVRLNHNAQLFFSSFFFEMK